MSTKNTVSLICIISALAPLSVWLATKTGFGIFVVLGVIASFAGLGLMAYAAFREQTTDDKSEKVSPRVAVTIFCCVGLWVAFVFYRALTH